MICSFFHCKLKRLIAIELKLGKFKAAYKGQMELYLRWLEKYGKEPGELIAISEDRLRSIFAEAGHDFSADICSAAEK